jgi:hypothetical protein
MHPTQNPVDALSVTPTAGQIEEARTWLAGYDNTGRDAYPALFGYLRSSIQAIAATADPEVIARELRLALAQITAFDQLDAGREDPVDPNYVLPAGIEGWALGRWAR